MGRTIFICLFFTILISLFFSSVSSFLKGKLRDGCKIVIFNGTFDMKSDAGGQGREETRLQLACNGTRIADPHARLGFVQPSALLRGISLKSITNGIRKLRVSIHAKLFVLIILPPFFLQAVVLCMRSEPRC